MTFTWLLLPVSANQCRPLQDTSVRRMSAGSQMYQGLLGVLSEKLSGLSDLRADLRDLLTHINKVTHTHTHTHTHKHTHTHTHTVSV